jgi:hypothetical protein
MLAKVHYHSDYTIIMTDTMQEQCHPINHPILSNILSMKVMAVSVAYR